MTDKIGDRFKNNYENRTRYLLPRRTYTIIRVDGKAFHTLTKKCDRPFDNDLISCMNETAANMCKNIQGTKFAYVQSDEISLLLTDFDDIKTDAWFNGNIQKMASISGSLATLYFNKAIEQFKDKFSKSIAVFDSRVFTIPESVEVENYFIWRQQDATRNSVQMVAQSLYSHKELHGKNTSKLQEMIFQKGINWNDFDFRYKRGGIISKVLGIKNGATRTSWGLKDTPIFSQDRDFLNSLIKGELE
jgi:tRNA(His) 5'-end guanylyltransferase